MYPCPLFTTWTHYIEKKSNGQAKKQDLSLQDKELERKVDKNEIHF